MVRRTYILQTTKTPIEIQHLVVKKAKAVPSFWASLSEVLSQKKTKGEFYYEIGVDIMYLYSRSYKYYPYIELEFRQYSEPKCKVVFAGLNILRVFYSIMFLVYLITFLTMKEGDLFTALVFLLIFILVPLYIYLVQKQFIKWITLAIEQNTSEICKCG